MAFGIPGSETSSDSGPFLSRIQYDARSGFFTNVDRVQDAGGSWVSRSSEPYRGPVFAVDFGSFEVGYIKLGGTPSFLLVPFGKPIPQQPEEMTMPDAQGKTKRAFSPGFRVKVMSSKTFGDAEPRYLAGTSKSLMGSMEDLFNAFQAAPEARTGKVPLVKQTGTKTLETTGKHGTTKNYAPVFTIESWVDRPAGFGERTVAPPTGAAAAPSRPAAPVPELAQRQAQAERELEDSALPF